MSSFDVSLRLAHVEPPGPHIRFFLRLLKRLLAEAREPLLRINSDEYLYLESEQNRQDGAKTMGQRERN